MAWNCVCCTFRNMNNNENCEICGTRNPDLSPSTNSNANSEFSKTSWNCPVCTLRNPLTKSQCQMCGTLNTSVNKSWECDDCGQMNTEASCSDCAAPRVFEGDEGLAYGVNLEELERDINRPGTLLVDRLETLTHSLAMTSASTQDDGMQVFAGMSLFIRRQESESDSKLVKLLVKVIGNEKYPLPDAVVYAVQSLNYILRLNVDTVPIAVNLGVVGSYFGIVNRMSEEMDKMNTVGWKNQVEEALNGIKLIVRHVSSEDVDLATSDNINTLSTFIGICTKVQMDGLISSALEVFAQICRWLNPSEKVVVGTKRKAKSNRNVVLSSQLLAILDLLSELVGHDKSNISEMAITCLTVYLSKVKRDTDLSKQLVQHHQLLDRLTNHLQPSHAIALSNSAADALLQLVLINVDIAGVLSKGVHVERILEGLVRVSEISAQGYSQSTLSLVFSMLRGLCSSRKSHASDLDNDESKKTPFFKRPRLDSAPDDNVSDVYLLNAIQANELHNVKRICKDGAAIHDEKPLLLAAEFASSALVTYILAKGADIDAVGDDGSALHVAAKKNRPDIVQTLLKCGANKQVKDVNQKTPSQVSSSSKITKMLDSKTKSKALKSNNLLSILYGDEKSSSRYENEFITDKGVLNVSSYAATDDEKTQFLNQLLPALARAYAVAKRPIVHESVRKIIVHALEVSSSDFINQISSPVLVQLLNIAQNQLIEAKDMIARKEYTSLHGLRILQALTRKFKADSAYFSIVRRRGIFDLFSSICKSKKDQRNNQTFYSVAQLLTRQFCEKSPDQGNFVKSSNFEFDWSSDSPETLIKFSKILATTDSITSHEFQMAGISAALLKYLRGTDVAENLRDLRCMERVQNFRTHVMHTDGWRYLLRILCEIVSSSEKLPLETSSKSLPEARISISLWRANSEKHAVSDMKGKLISAQSLVKFSQLESAILRNIFIFEAKYTHYCLSLVGNAIQRKQGTRWCTYAVLGYDTKNGIHLVVETVSNACLRAPVSPRFIELRLSEMQYKLQKDIEVKNMKPFPVEVYGRCSALVKHATSKDATTSSQNYCINEMVEVRSSSDANKWLPGRIQSIKNDCTGLVKMDEKLTVSFSESTVRKVSKDPIVGSIVHLTSDRHTGLVGTVNKVLREGSYSIAMESGKVVRQVSRSDLKYPSKTVSIIGPKFSKGCRVWLRKRMSTTSEYSHPCIVGHVENNAYGSDVTVRVNDQQLVTVDVSQIIILTNTANSSSMPSDWQESESHPLDLEMKHTDIDKLESITPFTCKTVPRIRLLLGLHMRPTHRVPQSPLHADGKLRDRYRKNFEKIVLSLENSGDRNLRRSKVLPFYQIQNFFDTWFPGSAAIVSKVKNNKKPALENILALLQELFQDKKYHSLANTCIEQFFAKEVKVDLKKFSGEDNMIMCLRRIHKSASNAFASHHSLCYGVSIAWDNTDAMSTFSKRVEKRSNEINSKFVVGKSMGRESAQVVEALDLILLLFRISSPSEKDCAKSSELWSIPKISRKIDIQLKDMHSAMCASHPGWMDGLLTQLKFLFSPELRFRAFQATAFGWTRNVNWVIAESAKSHSNSSNFPSIPIKKDRGIIHRRHLLKSAQAIIENFGCQYSALDIVFADEKGYGSGVTASFYSSVADLLHTIEENTVLPCWLPGEATDNGTYIYRKSGLFPRPLHKTTSIRQKVLKRFEFMGALAAKAMMDSHVFPLPLSECFMEMVLKQSMTVKDFPRIYGQPGQIIYQLHTARQAYRKGETNVEIDNLVLSSWLEAVDFSFIDPLTEQCLIDNGDTIQVTMDNVDEYLQSILDIWLDDAPAAAFRQGLTKCIPGPKLDYFYANELLQLIVGCSDLSWTIDTLKSAIRPGHGYTPSSPPFQYFLEVLMEMSIADRKEFLLFATGCPNLPRGGLLNLSPNFDITRRQVSASNVDAAFPFARTCTNTLHIPAYSSKSVLKTQLNLAIENSKGVIDRD